MTAYRLEWSIEKTKSMYDKHVKQTRSGKKSVGKVKKTPTRRVMVCYFFPVYLSSSFSLSGSTFLTLFYWVGRVHLKLLRQVVRQIILLSWKARQGGGT